MRAFIYQIKCLPTGRCYVGSAQDYPVRRSSHLCELRKGCHFNSQLQRSWNKYGEDSFEFSIIETVDNTVRYEEEQKAIDDCQDVFNTAKAGEPPSFLGGTQTPEVRARISSGRSGIPMPEETKEKLRIARTGRRSSPEAVRKMQEGLTGLKRSDQALENYRKAWSPHRRLEHSLKVKEANRRKNSA